MASHGISVGEVSMDVGKMMDSKTAKVDGLTGGVEYLCKKYKVPCAVPATPPQSVYFHAIRAFANGRQPLDNDFALWSRPGGLR